MKKFYSLLIAAIIMLALPMGMMGQTTTNFTLSSADEVTQNDITATFAKGSGSTAPTWYAAGLRLYASNTVTISSTNTITEIKFNWEKQGNKAFADATANVGNYTHPTTTGTGTWSGSANEVVFTLGTSGQLQLNTFSVTVGGSVAVATITTIDATGITNTDVYASTDAGSLSATVSAGGTAISGATVTWSGNNDAAATIASDGSVTLVGAGNVTFTATYAGVSGQYQGSSDTYDMTVTSSAPYVQPTTVEIIPNYTFWGQTAQFSGSTYSELSGSQDNVSLNWTRGTGSMYASTTAMRFYKDNTLVFTAPSGYEIKNIKITFSQTQSDLTFSPTGFDSSTNTWTGSSSTVTMSRPSSGSSYYQITNFTITIGLPSSNPSITADDVNIAFNATSGEIEYTLNNPATNGNLSVSENVDWISNAILNTTESKVTFTATANEATTPREGVITITYTYGDNETVTANVTVTQAAAPISYTTIPDLFAAATSTETPVYVTFNNWVVSGVSTNGKNVFVTDNNGNGFVIYSNSDMSGTYVVGNILSGTTVSCTLKKYNGFAELINLDAEDLTITPGGTVSTANVAMANLTGVNTSALLHYENLTCSVDNNKYYLSDGTTTLQVYNSLFAFEALEDGETYNITGIYQQYNSTKEILPRSAADIVKVEVQHEAYMLTVSTLNEHINGIYVFDAADQNTQLIADGQAGTAQVLDGTEVMVSVDIEAGYMIESLIVDGNDVTSQIVADAYTFTMPTHAVTITATAVEYVAPAGGNYVRISALDQLTDGSKVIIAARYDEDHTNGYYAMPGQTSGKPVGVAFTSETSGNDEILPATITASEDTYYWTVNVTDDGYTFTNADNQMIGWSSSTNFATGGNNTLWTIARETAGESAMVAEYEGFVITNLFTTTTNSIRAFAFNGTEFGAYAKTNMNASSYNFYLDFFVQTEAVEPETYTKHIIGYNSEQGNGSGNFYLIASPIGDVAPTNVTNMIKTDNNGKGYDLYRFNQNPVETEIDGVSTKLEWENYKQEGDHYHFNLESGKGYLYANSETVDLIFTGTAYSGTGEVSLTNNGDNDLSGWNLVGNPFTVKTYITGDYNVMNADGTEIIAATEDQDREENSVNPMEGIFVYTTEASTLQFSTTAPSKLSKRLALNLSRGRGVMDRAIVRFDDSQPMPKFQLKDNSTKVYIPMDGKDYAVVNAQEQGEMPVNFKAKENGTYTISINTKDVNFGYLHLIDNMTGDDIDLNVTPSYTFNAKADDYESRFKLVYAADNTDDNNFAFISNGEIILNGQGTVQIYDVNGRMISSYNDVTSISTSDMANGVYMLRLINGNNVKTQKIVVK
jgi:hypothetical protein